MNEKKKMKGLTKRILSFALSLAMVLTLMPGMSIEVKAADDWHEETIYGGSDGDTLGEYFKVSASVISDCEEGEWSLANIRPIQISNINGNSYIIKKLEIFGVDADLLLTSEDFSVDYENATISFGNELLTVSNINTASIKISLSKCNAYPNGVKIYYTAAPSHEHDWAYAADGATLYAYCTGTDGCDHQGTATDLTKAVSLTLTATNANFSYNETYTGAEIKDVDGTEIKSDTNNEWKNAGLDIPTISYYKVAAEGATTGGEAEDASTLRKTPGNYYASVTMDTATAVAAFKVNAPEKTVVTITDFTIPTSIDMNSSIQPKYFYKNNNDYTVDGYDMVDDGSYSFGCGWVYEDENGDGFVGNGKKYTVVNGTPIAGKKYSFLFQIKCAAENPSGFELKVGNKKLTTYYVPSVNYGVYSSLLEIGEINEDGSITPPSTPAPTPTPTPSPAPEVEEPVSTPVAAYVAPNTSVR